MEIIIFLQKKALIFILLFFTFYIFIYIYTALNLYYIAHNNLEIIIWRVCSVVTYFFINKNNKIIFIFINKNNRFLMQIINAIFFYACAQKFHGYKIYK